MLTELQQEHATRYALGELNPGEERDFAVEVRTNPEVRDFLHDLQSALDFLALGGPAAKPPPALKQKVMDRIRARSSPRSRRRSTQPIRPIRPKLSDL